ncbi:hypothetical protein A3D05_01605 [Candidatus Gottesmanbacteria bacterium RIFCSPHIGHO2_02_FULL_40_24]|uniref:Peptidase M50 domain-containing protein n=1 Tax=Candidatus Gottesmanbacteria bacterium RIFCSPHIGHO2_01_FULL_40_15 TaxID=1798376 RepID=A0A1F5YZE7_9BACT|nr:MAG: hypothetical protein A2777_04510 [Candidatus Gottesmanbacteria bacterium RIFCSPHIGHO2_01_FULL_40_15]OGG16362.1 MAG: hypothetical protein A3D05_01605 [Candidatus Gottesmanbacteria bacterium RIFCSPHIGHO2_02_FULL_40_24]OGG21297.1 MAG: hypothetical protein A3B48_04700 [Candidatus Gottesmanbacteria bacterium RIFCSPLOWO2_01_FULL_40_10]OGG23438.1 MAG: hypothetical protein A3E42_00125 [Candidatus Gottesmanbacteria bacterium RIFCSPHIGHO2_12_FULL_40_13]OGG33036.1 MAG: hypothetical protein A3I80_0
MIDLLFRNPGAFLIFAVLLLIVVTVHEFSHAFSADRLGDPTPSLMGRLTLNPFAHLDPIGTMLFVLVGFGWGKPVPFDPFNLRHPKKDSALISFAGPLSNILMAIISSVILRLLINLPNLTLSFLTADLIVSFIRLNILLAVFNLIPVHPLDGFKVVGGLLPEKYYHDWLDLEKYGMIFLLLLIFPFFGASPVLKIISPVMNLFLSILVPSQLGGII